MKKLLKKYYFKRSGGKDVLRKRRFITSLLGGISIVAITTWSLKPKPDTSSLKVKIKPTRIKKSKQAKYLRTFGSNNVSTLKHSPQRRMKKKSKQKRILKAKQVLISSNSSQKRASLGSSAVAELLTSIDSRDPDQLVRVKLLYGLYSNSRLVLKKNSTLLGKSSYKQGGSRAYLHFFSAIEPDGREVSIDAQALDSHGFSTGLIGKVHSDKAIKIAGSVALNVITAATGMMQKRSINDPGVQTQEFNAETALLEGLGNETSNQAKRTLSNVKSSTDYITINSGKDLIVILTKSIKEVNK